MKKTIGLFLIFKILQTAKLSSFDPSTFDYCSITCSGLEHSACNCEKKKPINLVKSDNDIANFRKQILQLHNEFRNKIASGKEKDCPKASNMMVLNYDLELEYISRCFGKIMPGWDHDKCRKKHNHELNAGQNLYSGEAKDVVKDAVTGWYNEVHEFQGDKKELLQNFYSGDHGHFTELVWAEVTHVGCVMVDVVESPNTIICNYAGNNGGGNFRDQSVYDFGEPCSKCPNQEKCNEIFPALCGKLEESNNLPRKENKKKTTTKKTKDKERNRTTNNDQLSRYEEIRKKKTMLKANDSICVHIDINLLCICILCIILPNFF